MIKLHTENNDDTKLMMMLPMTGADK